jgi:tetratricopeptide (TPR) repeat protein
MLSQDRAAGAGPDRRRPGSARALAFWLCGAALAAVGATRLAAGDLPRDTDGWIQLKSANFILWSDASERRTREVAADLEQVRATLAQLSPGLTLTAPCPTYIYVFKNGSALGRYPLEFHGHRQEGIAGFFLRGRWATYMAIDGDPRSDALHVVRHEYVHYLLHNSFSHLPLWLDEGLAEYYGTLHRTGDRVQVGVPMPEHIAWLRNNLWTPLDQLFAVDHSSKDYHEGIRQGTFYAESWAVTHYLLLGDPARRRQLVQMSKLMEGGVAQDKAFAQAFGGDYEALAREVRVYISRSIFPYQELPIPDTSQAGAAVQRLPPADVLYRLGDLLLAINDGPNARTAEHFQAALAADPRHGLATAGLGEVEEAAGRLPEAQERYQKAVELAPAEPLPHFLLGRLWLERPRQSSGKPEPSPAAEAELSRATELAPGFGEAWAALAIARMRRDPASPETLAAAEAASRLLPHRTDVTLNLALCHAENGQRSKADALIERARAGNASARDLATARENLSRIDHNRFVTAYNQAVALANSGNTAGAAEKLEALLKTTADPADQATAHQLRDQLAAGLNAPEKKTPRKNPR